MNMCEHVWQQVGCGNLHHLRSRPLDLPQLCELACHKCETV